MKAFHTAFACILGICVLKSLQRQGIVSLTWVAGLGILLIIPMVAAIHLWAEDVRQQAAIAHRVSSICTHMTLAMAAAVILIRVATPPLALIRSLGALALMLALFGLLSTLTLRGFLD